MLPSTDAIQIAMFLMKCPECSEYMSGHITQCNNGHNFCFKCKEKLIDCKICHAAFSPVRNLALQQLADSLLIPCVNSKFGCDEEILLAKKKRHDQECSYRDYECIPGCSWKGRRGDILSHFKNTHKSKLLEVAETKFRIQYTSSKDIWYLFAVHDELFWFNAHYKKDEALFVIIKYIGPKENRNKFKYELYMTSELGDNSLTFSSETHADFEDIPTMLSLYKCPHILHQAAKNFINPAELSCTVKIIRKIGITTMSPFHIFRPISSEKDWREP